LLTHPDMNDFFGEQLFAKEIFFSLVDGMPTSLAARRTRFNFDSNQWRERLNNDSEWWRFAAALKSLLMAADVAGSAMAPKGADIAAWVNKTLSQRANEEDMKRVVVARLKGASPRHFQESIGASKKRVTLVEAGTGTGKTAAAYMWAARHAAGKKLFFCYPTTGTATEGFLGYVHETEVEAELIHSRSIVDLAGIARVADDERGDHLLRIESLNAWSPKVVICTADTVLALVRNNRRGLYNSPAILSGAFVFDELHAYDNTMLEAVVALIRALPGASFLLMTASLPKSRKEFLLSHIEDIAEVPSPRDLEELPRYLFERCTGDDEALRIAKDYVARGKKVLWICNQVARAQAVFESFKYCCSAANYHSRFKYEHRVVQHRRIIAAFEDEKSVNGFVAVTTQVAEMSLDLDADLLICEVAPISALIQRLGRVNRRITPEHPGTPRKALFLSPAKVAPYDEADLLLANEWIDELVGLRHPLNQAELSKVFNALTPQEELRLNLHTRWLDSGWHAEPEPVRDVGYSVSVILAEDERACRESGAETVKRTIPMNYSEKVMQHWREWKGHLIAPHGAIIYSTETGAKLA
ncbi:MAG: CRISPR-associated helicase Cas3', partial [Acidobacteriota bacterium]|nr:CRISPR-associated helicase Cas3' [Acidobacteriota bacterium]